MLVLSEYVLCAQAASDFPKFSLLFHDLGLEVRAGFGRVEAIYAC